MPSLLRSVNYAFLSKSTPPTPEGQEAESLHVHRLTVWQSGHNVRTQTDYFFEKGTKVDSLLAKGMVYAYNGMNYQWFSPGREALTFSSRCRHPTPYWVPCSLIYPYYWLGGQQVNWSDIKDPERWLNRFDEAKYMGEESEEGLTFDIVSMPFPQMNMDEVHVYFARELGHYPIKWVGSVKKEEVSGTWTMRVTEYKTFEVDTKKLIFPYVIKVTTSGKEKGESIERKMTLNFYTDESLTPLQINPQLNEDLFTISPSLAKTVTDFDAELESGRMQPSTDLADDGRPLENTLPPVNNWGVGKIAFLVTSNLVLLLIIIFLLWRSRRK